MFALFLGSSSGPSPGKMHRETQTLREATRLHVHVAARDDGVVTTADCRVAGYLVAADLRTKFNRRAAG